VLTLGVAGAALAAVWHVLPAGAPPVYDTCLAEPYRPLGSNPAPTSAGQTFPANTDFPTSEVLTGESPAQAQILMTDGTFARSASPITVSIKPIPPPAPPPAGDRFDGNLYRLVATTAAGQMLDPQPQHGATIVLRATSSSGSRTIVRLDGNLWTKLQTFISGCGDEYEAVSQRLGDFAIVVTAGASPPAASTGGVPTALVVVIIVVVLAATLLVLFRLNRARR